MLTPERLLTQEQLKELLDYDPETGEFTWRVKRKGTEKSKRAGTISSSDGYLYICIDYRRNTAGRLAVLWMTGSFPGPGLEVDHWDRVRTNNRWGNLRIATKPQNKHNTVVRRNNKVGLKGVCQPSQRPGTFWSTIYVNKKNKHLGAFDCPAAAHLAYVVAAHQHFGQFAPSSYER